MILYVGLGRMGLPMATHATRAGQTVMGYDPSAERRAMLVEAGATAVADPAEALPRASAVVIMVGSQAQVEAIVAGADGVLDRCAPGTLAIIGQEGA